MAKQERRYRYSTGDYYTVRGNAAVRTMPDRRRQEREEQEYREELLRRVRAVERRERRQQQEYAAEHIILFAAALLAVATLFAVFMIMLSGKYKLSTELEANKTEYQELVRNNALLMDKIDRQTDYAAVYDYAVNQLGMQAPESQQVVYYQRTNTEHVEFRGVIPNE